MKRIFFKFWIDTPCLIQTKKMCFPTCRLKVAVLVQWSSPPPWGRRSACMWGAGLRGRTWRRRICCPARCARTAATPQRTAGTGSRKSIACAARAADLGMQPRGMSSRSCRAVPRRGGCAGWRAPRTVGRATRGTHSASTRGWPG